MEDLEPSVKNAETIPQEGPDVPPSEGDITSLKEKEALKEENESLKDRLMRTLAEIENLRKRSEKERLDALKYGVAPLAKLLLPVADNLKRALDSIPQEAENKESFQNFVAGVTMIEKQLNDAFSQCHVTPINTVGVPFSYHDHQAMAEVTDSQAPDGTVASILQNGYMLEDRLLRPAMVTVVRTASENPPHEDKGES